VLLVVIGFHRLCARSGDSFLLRSLLLARIESPVLLVVNSRRKSCLSALLSASVLEAAAGFSLCVQISIRGSSSSAELILRAGVSDRIAQASICFASQSLCASFMSSPTVALAPRSAPPAVFVQFFRTTSGAGCFGCPSLAPSMRRQGPQGHSPHAGSVCRQLANAVVLSSQSASFDFSARAVASNKSAC
jgi:hypothetical protein